MYVAGRSNPEECNFLKHDGDLKSANVRCLLPGFLVCYICE